RLRRDRIVGEDVDKARRDDATADVQHLDATQIASETQLAGFVNADIDRLPAAFKKRASAVKDQWQHRLFDGALDSFARRQSEACNEGKRHLEESAAFHVGKAAQRGR